MIEFGNGRVFIDVGTGCGNSCQYCYVNEKDKPQSTISENQFQSETKRLIEDHRFNPGVTVVSFCPHTEPFKTSASIERLLLAIKILAPFKNVIQIATKEIIPATFLEKVKKLVEPNQLVIFISISCFLQSQKVEPYAAEYRLRLANIKLCHNYGVRNVLYLKPFLLSDEDVKILPSILKACQPDAICIGIVYSKDDMGEFHHPTNKEMRSSGATNNMLRCAEMIRQFSTSPVFLNSTCANCYFFSSINHTDIPQVLCVKCNPICFERKWNI